MSRKKKSRPKLPSDVKIGDVLQVVWEDHFAEGGWKDLKKALDTPKYFVESVGAYIGKNNNNKALVIAQNHVIGSATVSDTITILWPNIQSIKRLLKVK